MVEESGRLKFSLIDVSKRRRFPLGIYAIKVELGGTEFGDWGLLQPTLQSRVPSVIPAL